MLKIKLQKEIKDCEREKKELPPNKTGPAHTTTKDYLTIRISTLKDVLSMMGE